MPLVSIIGRESEGGGRTKYVLTAVGLPIILPVLDRCLVGWLVGCYDDGLFIFLLKSILLLMTLEKNAYLLDG